LAGLFQRRAGTDIFAYPGAQNNCDAPSFDTQAYEKVLDFQSNDLFKNRR